MVRSLIISLFLLSPALSFANSIPPDVDKCFYSESDKFNIDVLLLKAIAFVESSFNHKAVAYPPDGTITRGMMQVNSSNDSLLKQLGITEEQLFDACTNIGVGTHILSQFIRRYGDTWRAVGSYYVGNRKGRVPDSNRREYVRKVKLAYQWLSGSEPVSPNKVIQHQVASSQKKSRMVVIE